MTTVRGASVGRVRGFSIAMAVAVAVLTAPAADLRAAQADSTRAAVSIGALEALMPGGVARLVVTAEAGISAVTATAFGDPVHLGRVSPERWEGLVGVDLDQQPGSYQMTVSAISAAGTHLAAESAVVVKPRHYSTRKLTVGGQFVDPTPDELQRIKIEAARMAAIYAGVSERRWTGPFVPPVAGPATSNFGSRSVFNGQPRAPHAGIDYRGATGTPVVAPGAAQVVLAENLFFTGNTVILDHGLGLFSLYAHLSRIDVVSGQSLSGGVPLGLVGATGRVTGPHLHWALRLGRARIDPALAMDVIGR